MELDFELEFHGQTLLCHVAGYLNLTALVHWQQMDRADFLGARARHVADNQRAEESCRARQELRAVDSFSLRLSKRSHA